MISTSVCSSSIVGIVTSLGEFFVSSDDLTGSWDRTTVKMGGLADCSFPTMLFIRAGWVVPTSMISAFVCPSSFVRDRLSLKVWTGVVVGFLSGLVTGGQGSVVIGASVWIISEVVVLAMMSWEGSSVQSDEDILKFGGGGSWSFAIKCVECSFKLTLEFIFNILLYQGALLGLSEVSDFMGRILLLGEGGGDILTLPSVPGMEGWEKVEGNGDLLLTSADAMDEQ